MIKYKVVSGKFVQDSEIDTDFVYGIEDFPSAQNIQIEKLKEFDYSKVSYYGHTVRDAV